METDVSEARGNKGFFLLLAIGAMALIAAILLQGGGGSSGVGGGDVRPAIFAAIPYADAVAANSSDGKVLVVKFTADWCPPCKVMNRETFSEPGVIAAIQKAGTVIEVDIDEHADIASAARIEVIPTMIAYKGGKEVARASGGMGPSEFTRWLERSGG